MLSVLLFGATGYLGGTVLTDLEKAGVYDITCLVRPNRESLMKQRKSAILLGSHSDLEMIENAGARMDLVINAATSDDLELTRAINCGLRRGRESGRKGLLVHISGTQLIESEPTGKLEDVPKYDDLDVDQIKSIPDSALHRLIDLEQITASIVCPGVIFGRGTGPSKTISSPFPNIVRLALRHKRVIYAGDGTNIWCHVYVQDVSDMIMMLIKANLDAKEPAGFERFYFAESGEHQKLKLSIELGTILYEKGLVLDSQPLAVPADDSRAPSWANRTTARCLANRARHQLGWTPKLLLEDMFKAEISDILSTVRCEITSS
ncbi:hypothetical protein BP5796_03671 [Coleophoma crateriformis]|uniref:NAD-dependent epimerase/dehydratase domain-containing protein n=1 Tax=Coleophoma crateriformis TaxID=565419 RepID=A0A3D8SGB8_9HELO|nr:hypothetical protein BP5796_03671 [Coleophoma crateriformis]